MIARGTGFVKGSKERAKARLSAHFRYLERESATQGQRLFSASENQVSRRDAIQNVMEHATQARVRFHKVVLSPANNERVLDWQRWTRDVIGDLEHHLNIQLTWYAIHHTNTAHPHVHVIISGTGAHMETGAPALVRLQLPSYELLRKSGQAHSEYHWDQRVLALLRSEEPALYGRLLPGEASVGTYQELSRSGSRGDGLTPHHMPAARVMQAYNIPYEKCICINVEQPTHGAGRHRMTRSYGQSEGNGEKETLRDALARDVRDLRRIYRSQEHDIRSQLQTVITHNKQAFPELYRKERDNERRTS